MLRVGEATTSPPSLLPAVSLPLPKKKERKRASSASSELAHHRQAVTMCTAGILGTLPKQPGLQRKPCTQTHRKRRLDLSIPAGRPSSAKALSNTNDTPSQRAGGRRGERAEFRLA